MRKSIATVSLSGTLEEKLVAAAQVGFDGVELFENDFITSALSPAQLRRRVADLGLRIELYQPLRDIEAVPEPLFARNLHRAEAKLTLMNELGVDTVLVCSNVSPASLADDALAAEQLHRLAELAGRYGVRVAYEALAWGRHVNTLTHAWKLVEAVDHPQLGICLDSFHILSRREDPAAIRDLPGSKIAFVQLADAPQMSLDVLQWSRHYRCFPGQGSFDLTAFLDHVLTAGYTGPVSLEVFNDVFRQADAVRTATDALRSLIALEESVGLVAPEPAVELSGHSFVEIAVDPLAELASQQLLGGLGFQLVGQHRSKPVQMWRQGNARVLLNRTRPRTSEWSRGDAAITAFAVESSHPDRSGRRAQAMLAPELLRRHGPGEAQLFATESPDGTSVFFCHSDPDDGGSWLADFKPVHPETPEAALPPVVTAIDHIGLSHPAHQVDEAVLFYQTVLGLDRAQEEEVADPYGLMRRQAMAGSGRRVRLVLNVPTLGGDQRPETAHFQHVAFACEDIFVVAWQARQAKLPVLSIPRNYYSDLAARTALTADQIDVMRDLSICYDSDEAGGEYLHFFTAMVGRRLFFEIVQRVNGYDGYGTANTPVRMAAQYRQAAVPSLSG